MTSLLAFLRSRYAAWQCASSARLSADQREDIQAFNRHWQAHRWRNGGLLLLLWLAATLGVRFGTQSGWVEASAIALLLCGSLGFALLSAWFGHAKFQLGVRWFLIVIVITVVGAVSGGIVGRYIKTGSLAAALDIAPRTVHPFLVAGLVAGLIYACLLALVVHLRRRQLQARNEELAHRAAEEKLARQVLEARLKLMQAQVEPHFLFNTLASVQHLAEGRAPEAAQLTRDLIAFLRAGLSGLRGERSTLKNEFELARAYLAIMQRRLGDRLTVELDLPAALAACEVPPAMLISLVENAIKHGIEPAPRGGTVRVFASLDGDDLVVGVADTGMGLASGPTMGGVGLGNIRDRLQALFGARAALTLEEMSPHGVKVWMRFPSTEQGEGQLERTTV